MYVKPHADALTVFGTMRSLLLQCHLVCPSAGLPAQIKEGARTGAGNMTLPIVTVRSREKLTLIV